MLSRALGDRSPRNIFRLTVFRTRFQKFSRLFHGGFCFFDDDDAGSLIWDQGQGDLPIVQSVSSHTEQRAPPANAEPSTVVMKSGRSWCAWKSKHFA